MSSEIQGYVRKSIEKALKSREESHTAIANGKQFPTIHLLYAGAPFIKGSLVLDVKMWAEKESLRAETLRDADTRARLAEAMLTVSHEATADNLLALRALLASIMSTDEAVNDYTYMLRKRLEIYLSAYDDKDAHKYCATEALSMASNNQDDVNVRCLITSATLFAARSERGVSKGFWLDEDGSDVLYETRTAESLAVAIFGSFRRYDAAKAAAAKEDAEEKQAHIDAVKAASNPVTKPEKGAGLALDHRQIMAPVVDRPAATVMGTLDDALVLANHFPFGDDDEAVGVNAQADALVGEGGRYAVAGALEADETGRRHWLAVFDKAIERP